MVRDDRRLLQVKTFFYNSFVLKNDENNRIKPSITIAKAKLAKPAITATTGIVCVKKTTVKITPSVTYLAKYRIAKNLGCVP